MTATADAPLPRITCPSSLIASCPPLLGFYPERSLICLAHRPGASSPVVARIDVVEDDRAEACADDLAQRLARTGGSHVTVVLWLGVPDGADRRELPGVLLVECLERSLAALGLSIDLAVATNATVWWPLLCPTSSCCSHDARIWTRKSRAAFGCSSRSRDMPHWHLATISPSSLRPIRSSSPARSATWRTTERPPPRWLIVRREVDQMWQALRPLSPTLGSRQRGLRAGSSS